MGKFVLTIWTNLNYLMGMSDTMFMQISYLQSVFVPGIKFVHPNVFGCWNVKMKTVLKCQKHPFV